MGNRQDYFVEDVKGPLDNIDMAIGEGIERTRIDSHSSDSFFVSFYLLIHRPPPYPDDFWGRYSKARNALRLRVFEKSIS
jgi:hypothetical protein